MAEFTNRKISREAARERREEKNAYERARRAKHGHRWVKIKSRYGLTEARYNEILREQNGLCACCKKRPPVDIDHDHGTKEFRGLLCRACNVGIGLLGDTLDGLLLAVQYLQSIGKGDS